MLYDLYSGVLVVNHASCVIHLNCEESKSHVNCMFITRKSQRDSVLGHDDYVCVLDLDENLSQVYTHVQSHQIEYMKHVPFTSKQS